MWYCYYAGLRVCGPCSNGSALAYALAIFEKLLVGIALLTKLNRCWPYTGRPFAQPLYLALLIHMWLSPCGGGIMPLYLWLH